MRVALIIPTYNGGSDINRLLKSLENQLLKFDIFIVDSSSTDGTFDVIQTFPVNLITIAGSQFNHGGTRQMMVLRYPEYNIYVFMTQDAYLEDEHSLVNLINPFKDASVGAVCGRQLPHYDASPLAQHARLFNYPEKSLIKVLADSSVLGLKTAFVSNSFTAYRGTALDAVGGFPNHVILSEDMYVAAKMLLKGWRVAYAGDAQCRHSHNYTLTDEFRRYFDQGVFHGRERWIRDRFGSAGGEGLRYVISELKFLGIAKLYLWPGAFLRNACKLLAYKLGQLECILPLWLKKSMSMNRSYW
jgi:rhamnosyltransferase